jgi:DNA-binding response OmpR family regulator
MTCGILIPNMSTLNPTILVVDDEPDIVKLVEISLKMSRFEVTSALSGPLAIESLKDHRPDLVLLDIMMPGMSGYDVCQWIMQNPGLKNLPVVFLTAKGQTGDAEKGLQMGAIDYIVKPFDPYELGGRLMKVLQR